MEAPEKTGDCDSEGDDDWNDLTNNDTTTVVSNNSFEDVYLCALCGQDLRTPLVKVEAAADTGDDSKELEQGFLSDSISERLSSEASAPSSSPTLQPSRWSQEERLIYSWFLKWFKVNLTGPNRGKKTKRNQNLGWDPDGGKDVFPFCFQCQCQLIAILALQKALEELESKIQSKVEEVKEKATCCEDVFDELKVYGKDVRYKRLRKQIVTGFSAKYPIERPQSQPRRTEIKKKAVKTRMSSRKKALICTVNDPSSNSVPSSEALPIVLLTTCDKVSAEQHLTSTAIKSELPDHLDDIIEKLREENSEDEDSQRDFCNQDTDSSNFKPGKSRKSRKTRKSKTSQSHSKKIKTKTSKTCDNSLLSTEHEDNWVDDDNGDDDYQPINSPPLRAKRVSSTKKSKKSTKNRKWKIIDPDDDDNFDPPTPPPFGVGTKRKKKVDEDFTVNEAQVESDEFDDAEEDNFQDDLKTGMRVKLKPVVDLEKRTISYNGLVFSQVEPFSENRYECSECCVPFKNNPGNIRSHYIRKHTDTYVCKQCGYRAEATLRLQDHIDSVHKGLAVPVRSTPSLSQCSVCTKPLKSSKLKAHEWSHKSAEERRQAIENEDSCVPSNVKRSYQCEECGYNFAQRSKLEKHKQVKHPSGEEVKSRTMELCAECGGTFFCLKSHRRNVHGVDRKKMYTCLESNCGKQFKTLPTLTKHKNAVHRKLRPYKCSQCPREFAIERSLKKHLDLHNGVRPWKCEHCTSSFAHKSNLQRHVGIYHTAGSNPRRKPYTRGPAMLPSDVRKRDLINEGRYLPPSALATWAAGREPTSHFPVGVSISTNSSMTSTQDIN